MTTRTRSWAALAVAAIVVAALALVLVVTFATDRPMDSADPRASVAPGATPSPGPTAPAHDDGAAEPDPDVPDADPDAAASDDDADAPDTSDGAPGASGSGDQNHDEQDSGARNPGDRTPAGRTPDVSLEWTGPAGTALTVSGSLWGTVTVVPGDADTRTITVRNDGPADGILTASIVNATAFRDPADPHWVDDTFYDDLTVNGISGTALEGQRTRIHEVELARGATAQIPLSFAFDGWSGNRTGGGLEEPSGVIVNPDGVGPRVFAFDVQLRITGDTAAGRPGGDQSTGVVAHTGGAVLPRSPWFLPAAALLLLVAAGTSRSLYRRPAQEGHSGTTAPEETHVPRQRP